MCGANSDVSQPGKKLNGANGPSVIGRTALNTSTAPMIERVRNTVGTGASLAVAFNPRKGAPSKGALAKEAAMERLSGLDASFLYFETPSMHMHVCATI